MSNRNLPEAGPTPRRPRVKRVRMDRETRRQQLTECAIRAFAERGIARAGHADVARLAPTSVSTVFEYFPTRSALLEAVLAETESFLQEVMAHGVGAPTALNAVLDIFHAFEACVDQQRHHMRVWLDWSTSVREDVWPRYVVVQEAIIDTFRATIEGGIERGEISSRVMPEDAARIVVGQAHMVVMMRFAGVERSRVVNFVDHMIESTLPQAKN